MSKPRKTPVPLPGLQSKFKVKPQKTKVPPPKSTLSQEFVGESDDSSDEAAPAQQKTPLQIGIHPPKANGTAKATPKSAKKPNETPKPAAKAKPPAKPPAKPTAKKVVPKQIATEEQGVESTSSSAESEDEGTDIKAAQQRQAASTLREASESTSSSETSSDGSEEEPAAKATPKSATSQPKPTQAQSHNVEFQASRPYAPPEGFAPVSTARASASKSTGVLDTLNGKQVWHITAPTGVSLEALREIAMQQAMRGETVISHKGCNYGFSEAEQEANGEREVVIPRQGGYTAVSARISHSFSIRQVIDLPELSSKQADPNTGSEAAASITRSTIRAPRPQVKGLKMRYFPSGVEDHTATTLGFSDSEDEAPAKKPAGLGIPNDLHLPLRLEKRKHAEVNGNDGVESSPKKHKKHQTPEEIQKKAEKKAKKEKKRQKEQAKTKP